MTSYVQSYPLTIPAGGSEVILMDFEGITCIEANLSEFMIEINDGPRARFRRQFEFAAPRGQRIQKLRVINDQLVPLTVTFLGWLGLFRDRRSLSNDVQGFNPVSLQDITDSGFACVAATAGVAGGNYGAVLFRNPPGSDKIFGVDGATVSVSATAVVRVIFYSGTLAVAAQLSQSILAGNGDGILDIYQNSTEAAPVSPGTRPIWRNRVDPAGSAPIEFKRPLLLPEGWGVLFQPTIANISLDVSLQHLEIDG